MKTNTKTRKDPVFTHEGARAKNINIQSQLRRSVMACMLWEDEFYESGVEIASRIADLVKKNDPAFVAALAIEAREEGKLRHVPLLLVRELARNEDQRHVVADTLARVIQRPDELAEFLAIYWKDGKDQPVASGVKKGLARAFTKFDEYALAKYNRDGDVTLRDVLFICHAKPKDMAQAKLWQRLVDDELAIPDTWETELSSGGDKKEVFTRLLAEGKLGALAFLRNLRNMAEAGVDRKLVLNYVASLDVSRVLPFRFIAAARYAPWMEAELETAMIKCVAGAEKLRGTTQLLIDVSDSMNAQISSKSDLMRMDAACGLAILLREICETVSVATFSNSLVTVPNRRGFALRDAIVNSQRHAGTRLGQALQAIDGGSSADRLIVITDEQSHDRVSDPKTKGYMLNVASNQNGVGYGKWTHIDGWSESCVKFIQALESEE